MNTGVEILLKRMKDCPEDFYYNATVAGMTRWSRLVDHAIGEELLNQEEYDAIQNGLKEVRRTRFTELVMKELSGAVDETSDEGKSYSVPKTNTYSAGVPQHILDAQKYQTEIMRQHLDVHRVSLEGVENMPDKDRSKMLEMLKSYVAYNKKKANTK